MSNSDNSGGKGSSGGGGGGGAKGGASKSWGGHSGPGNWPTKNGTNNDSGKGRGNNPPAK